MGNVCSSGIWVWNFVQQRGTLKGLCISPKYKKGPLCVMKGWAHTMEIRQGVHDKMSVCDKLGWEVVLHIQTSHQFSLI